MYIGFHVIRGIAGHLTSASMQQQQSLFRAMNNHYPGPVRDRLAHLLPHPSLCSSVMQGWQRFPEVQTVPTALPSQ